MVISLILQVYRCPSTVHSTTLSVIPLSYLVTSVVASPAPASMLTWSMLLSIGMMIKGR